MLNHNINRKQAIAVGLLYPAMLGTIFYSMFTMLQSSLVSVAVMSDRWPYCAIMLSTLAVYIVDYVYTAAQKELDWFSFSSSFIVISLMYFAFDGVNIDSHAPFLSQHCYALALTYAVFAVVDVIHRRNYGSWWQFLVGYEIVLFTTYTAFGVMENSPSFLAIFSLVNAILFGIIGNAAYRPEALTAKLYQVCRILINFFLIPRAMLLKIWAVKRKPEVAVLTTETTKASTDFGESN
jgi:hypothetical protein